MNALRLIRHAALIVAGVFLFAFGASRMISGPVDQVAKAIRGTQQTYTAEAGR